MRVGSVVEGDGEIPPPDPRGKYPWHDMTHGDSFAVQLEGAPASQVKDRIRKSFRRFKEGNPYRTVSVRIVTEDERTLRVYLIEAE